jgi:apolipoprotein D and lipocalin family protein
MKRIHIFLFTGILILSSCVTPQNLRTDAIPAVAQLDLQRYAGNWYEIVRMPHRFEAHLQQVTASYTILPDGKISVLNRGYDVENGKWSEAEGSAWRPDEQVPGELKVSFFWIFSSLYKVILLDEAEYQWAVVTSTSKEYLWVLAREPQMPDEKLQPILDRLAVWGFDLDKLQYVDQKKQGGAQ